MLIILDRDGVINYDSVDYIKSPAEWIAIPGSLEAIARLNQMGHIVTVATNQSGIGRGFYSERTLEAIHQKMRHELAAANGHLAAIIYCPHHPQDNCSCRKPKPGMLLTIAQQFQADLTQALLIGDSASDMAAAKAIGCQAIFVASGKDPEASRQIDGAIPVYPNLAGAVEAIIASQFRSLD